MYQKRDYVIGSIVIYVFLFVLLIMIEMRQTDQINISCHPDDPCVRFCCYDKELCKEKFIRENFNSSMFTKYNKEGKHENVEFKILIGRPKCSLKKVLAENKDQAWTFTSVRMSCNLFQWRKAQFQVFL